MKESCYYLLIPRCLHIGWGRQIMSSNFLTLRLSVIDSANETNSGQKCISNSHAGDSELWHKMSIFQAQFSVKCVSIAPDYDLATSLYIQHSLNSGLLLILAKCNYRLKAEFQCENGLGDNLLAVDSAKGKVSRSKMCFLTNALIFAY